MKNGKYICETLKQIRLDIARANGIKYLPRECRHEGDCAGTCPACESEVRYLEREITRRRSLGKAAVVASVSLGVMSLTATSCDFLNQSVRTIVHGGNHEPLEGEVQAPSIKEDSLRAELYTMQSDKSFIAELQHHEPKAVFPGGQLALFNFMKKNFVCPEVEDENTFTIIEVTICPDGTVSNGMAHFAFDSAFNAEALRVTRLLPKFEPARDEKGTAVYSTYYLLFDAKRLGPDK